MNSVSFTGVSSGASNQQQNVTASEANYTGSFTATTSSAAIATVNSPSTGLFTITAAGAGMATITIHDSFNQSVTVQVSVPVTTIGVQ